MDFFAYPTSLHYQLHQELHGLARSLQDLGECADSLMTEEQRQRLSKLVLRLANLAETATAPLPLTRRVVPPLVSPPLRFSTSYGTVYYLHQGQVFYERGSEPPFVQHSLWQQQFVVDNEIAFSCDLELLSPQFPNSDMAELFAQTAILQVALATATNSVLPVIEKPEAVSETGVHVSPVIRGSLSLEQCDELLLAAARVMQAFASDRITGSHFQIRTTPQLQGALIEVRSSDASILLASGLVSHTRDASGIDTLFSSLNEGDFLRFWALAQELNQDHFSTNSLSQNPDRTDLGFDYD